MAFQSSIGIQYPNNFTDALMDGSVPNTMGQIDHIISGELITVESTSDMALDYLADEKVFENTVKLELVNKLVDYMFKNNKIQFTKQVVASTGLIKYRAYVYVTPNDQTNVVRTLKR